MNLKKFLIAMAIMCSFLIASIMGATNVSMATNTDNIDIEMQVDYSEVEILPSGGKAYVFYIDGVKNKLLVPPEGFNPLKATDAQLEEYGFQPRPTDAKALAEWEEIMSHYKSTPVPKSLHVKKKHNLEANINNFSLLQSSSTLISYNWSGYMNTGSSGAYKAAQGWFYQPTQIGGSSDSYAGSWIGLGGYNTHKLIQAGTAMHDYNYNAFYEYNDANGVGYGITCDGLTISPNDKILLLVGYQQSNDLAVFSVDNLTKGQYWQMAVENGSNYYDGSSAEWIEERPYIFSTGALSPLANYGTITWNNATTSDVFGYFDWSSLGSHNYEKVIMVSDDGERILSIPNNLTSNTSFTDFWHDSN